MAQRSCWQRVTDRKAWWVGFGLTIMFLLLLFGGIAGIVERAQQQQECLRTDGAGLAAVVLFGLSLGAFVATSVFACCATDTHLEFEERKANIINNSSAGSSRVTPDV